jgi:hypothetical protein
MTLSLAIRFLHILVAAVWLGSALFWPGALRRALGLGAPHPAPALALARKGLGLDLGFGVATLATGLVYASPLGGVPIRTGIFVGLFFAAARVALLVGLARPAVRRAGDAFAAGRLDDARTAAKPVAAYAGVAHLLWLGALVTMVFPI